MHYRRLRKHGTTELPVAEPKTEKTCGQCREALPISEFYVFTRLRSDGVSHANYSWRCKACHALYGAAQRQRDPEAYRQYLRNWRVANRDYVTERARLKYAQLRREVLEAYGGACACCGENTPQFLGVDHVHNDGAEHRRELGGATGGKFYAWLKRNGFPRDGRFQLLCHNCNLAKALYGECPHLEGRSREPLATLPDW
jgi:hypothetical protein